MNRPTADDDAKSVVLRYLQALREKDLNGALELLSPEAVFHIPGSHPLAGAFHGTAEIVGTFMASLNERLAPDAGYAVDVKRVIAEGDHVAVECVSRSTTRNGEPYVIDISALFTVADGRISEMREYFDTQYFARTLFGTD
ncbi:nuclear transport factor 2 family protein [Kitasatospora sp. NPDC056446]|uniref:nuclear transport factor 2 family protein n=1 Tax=Kitasatospora sp. NPDC056446 TaxID=3345819 RepID=UPI00369A70AD